MAVQLQLTLSIMHSDKKKTFYRNISLLERWQTFKRALKTFISLCFLIFCVKATVKSNLVLDCSLSFKAINCSVLFLVILPNSSFYSIETRKYNGI